ARSPKTLERVPVPAKKTVKFKVGRLMKIALEGDARLEGARRAGASTSSKPKQRVSVTSDAQAS
ncbi:MAG: HU family DNA-binding protein, partial [Planctomycetes bacterium]|nr:HU family DNA-binding protein [Planctomycetota bacterium]